MKTVKMRFRKLKDGRFSIYLDHYDTETKERFPETLGLIVSADYDTPKGKRSNLNREALRMANEKLLVRQLEAVRGENNVRCKDNKQEGLSLTEQFERIVKQKNHITYNTAYDLFSKYLAERGHTLETISDWEEEIQQFQTFLLGLKRYNGSSNKNLSSTSVNVYMKRIKIVLEVLRDDGIITHNPFKNIKITKAERRAPTFLSLNEIAQLTQTECKNDFVKYAFLFCCFTGLRLSDVQKLKKSDIAPDSSHIRVITQKTKHTIQMPLSKQAKEHLNQLIALTKNADDIISVNLTAPNMRKYLSEWGEQAGIKKRIYYHAARHTFGSMLVLAGVDLAYVRELMTHKSFDSTLFYVHLFDNGLQESIHKLSILE